MSSLVAWVSVTEKARLRVIEVDVDENHRFTKALEVTTVPTLRARPRAQRARPPRRPRDRPGHRGSHPPACPAATARTDAPRGSPRTRLGYATGRRPGATRCRGARGRCSALGRRRGARERHRDDGAGARLLVLPRDPVALPGRARRVLDRREPDRRAAAHGPRSAACCRPRPRSLLGDSLRALDRSRPAPGLALVVVGFVLALWSTTSAATTLMKAVTAAFGRDDERGFVRKRAARAAARRAASSPRRCSSSGCSCFGPFLQRWVGDAVGAPTATAWVWWTAQWPLLAGRAAVPLRRAALPRPRRPAAALAAGHAGRRGLARDLARRVGRVRVLHGAFRLVQQDVGHALGGRDHADLAVAHEPRAAVRRRGQRGGPARQDAGAGEPEQRSGRSAGWPSLLSTARRSRADDRAAGAAAATAARSRSSTASTRGRRGCGARCCSGSTCDGFSEEAARPIVEAFEPRRGERPPARGRATAARSSVTAATTST